MNRRKKALVILAALHGVILALCAGYYLTQKQSRFYGEYRNADSRYYSVFGGWNDEKQGYYVDGSAGETGLFTCGPYMELKKGIYDVTIFYESSGTGNQCRAYAEDEVECYSDAFLSDTIELDPYHTVKTFTIRNRRDCEDFEVQTFYGGDGSLLIKGIVVSQGAANSLYMILKILCFTALADVVLFFFYARKKQLFSNKTICVGMILAGTICYVSSPLLRDGMHYDTTDLNFILMRIEGLKDGLLSGAFPVRIQPDWLNGYGYATSIFYGDLFLVIPALLRIFGVSVQGAYFLYLFGINTATCLTAYFCFKGMFRARHIAVAGACIYTLSTFRLTLVYVLSRGGMLTAYTFLPLIAYAVYLIYYDSHNKKSWFYLALGMTGLIQSHLLTCEITAFTLAAVILFSARRFFKKDKVLAMAKAVGASVVLNIGFLIPMLDYMGNDLYVSSDAWKSVYNYIQKNGEDGAGFLSVFREGNSLYSPDLLLLLGMALFLFVLLLVPKKNTGEGALQYREIGKVSFAVSALLLLMSTRYFPWDRIEDLFPAGRMAINSLQYPNRFYQTATVLMVITLLCALKILKERMKESDYRSGLGIVLMLCLFFSGFVLSDVINHDPVTTVYDTEALDDNRISTKEYLPEGADPARFVNETPVTGEGIVLDAFTRDGLYMNIQCTNTVMEEGYMELPLVYYEGYCARGTGQELRVSSSENKTVLVWIPGGFSGEISVSFKEPAVWTIAFYISVAGTAVFTVVFLRRKRGKKSSLS